MNESTDLAELWDDAVPTTEELVARVRDVSRTLEDELARGDHAAAQASWDKLIAVYPALKNDIDVETDPAVRDPLLDVYEAAVELRIRAASVMGMAKQREDYFRLHGVEQPGRGGEDD